MSRRVYVTNIPIRLCVSGWVDVPEAADVDDLNKVIADSIYENGYYPESLRVEGSEIDESVIEKWEFTTPLEER